MAWREGRAGARILDAARDLSNEQQARLAREEAVVADGAPKLAASKSRPDWRQGALCQFLPANPSHATRRRRTFADRGAFSSHSAVRQHIRIRAETGVFKHKGLAPI